MAFKDLDSITSWFWELIGRGARDPERMRTVLSSLSRDELERFAREFEWVAVEMSGRRFAEAHADSEDIVQDVAGWAASQGKEYFARVYDSPELFPDIDELDLSKSFVGLAESVYEERFGEEMPDTGSP